jgi:hypothetical protein
VRLMPSGQESPFQLGEVPALPGTEDRDIPAGSSRTGRLHVAASRSACRRKWCFPSLPP